MKSTLIIISILILLGVVFFIYKSPLSKDKTYNWNLELTKPLDYSINLKSIHYYKNNKEIKRLTTLNSTLGWLGNGTGGVLHSKIKDYLPDSVAISWEETDTEIMYNATFPFPKQKIVNFWNQNHNLLKEKWGDNYPQGQLSLKLGISPGGLLVLWIHDLDINTTGFAMEVDTFTATAKNITKEQLEELKSSFAIHQFRYGTPHFYPVEEKNVVAIHVGFYNGESSTINLKRKNGSLLEQMNSQRGWGLAKFIRVHWFTKEGVGYKSTYTINIDESPIKNKLETLGSTHFIYLLDRPNLPNEDWSDLPNKHIFQLNEVQREPIKKKR